MLLLNEEIQPLNEDKKRMLLIQVPLQKKVKKLWINLLMNKKEENEKEGNEKKEKKEEKIENKENEKKEEKGENEKEEKEEKEKK